MLCGSPARALGAPANRKAFGGEDETERGKGVSGLGGESVKMAASATNPKLPSKLRWPDMALLYSALIQTKETHCHRCKRANAPFPRRPPAVSQHTQDPVVAILVLQGPLALGAA